ncbi:MAG TPA: aldehyde dehydrogenase family protein, partial [Devosia sp.]|nr:aldehyde dehydrogenase family protein [Devosia sp.]
MSDKQDIAGLMQAMGKKAAAAARVLASASTSAKRSALLATADCIDARSEEILSANAKDMDKARERGMSASFLDRLELTPRRIKSMASDMRKVAALDDPVGVTTAEWDVPSGLHIRRVRTPLGVIGIIFESRPNVTADAGALCLMSGNAAILRGGSDSFLSSTAIHDCFLEGLKTADLPRDAIQL